MKVFGFEIKRKVSSPLEERPHISQNRYRLLDINDIMGAFNPKIVDWNLVTLFHTIVEIQHPISLIVDRCLNAKITLKNYKDESDIWNNDKINKFLEQPNPIYSFDEFLTTSLCYYLVTGNTYLTSDIGNFKTNQRWRYADNYYILPSHFVDMELRNDGRVNAFSYQTISDIIKSYSLAFNGQYMTFEPESILHIKDTNLEFNNKSYKGISKLSGCKRPVSNLVAQYEARNAIFVKRGALGAIFSKDKDEFGYIPFTEKEKKENRQKIDQTYGVTGGRETLMVLDKPIEFVRFSMSIQELQPYEEYLSDTIAISSAFSIPRDMAINKDKSTYANQDGSEKSLYENVAIPLTNKWLKSLSNWMGLTSSGMYLNADFSHVPCMQEDKKEAATTLKFNTEAYSKLYDDNTITFNEKRIGLGYEKIEGMDKFKKEIDNGKDSE